jgi:hypothetical protein
VLLWLASNICPTVAELERWRSVGAGDLQGALQMWLAGQPEDAIDTQFGAAWKAIRPNDLDTVVPWVLTAAIDFIATEADASGFRELAHRRLAPVRLRYGVPGADLCELVRDGFDRDEALAIAGEFRDAPPGVQMEGLRVFAQRWKEEQEAAARLAQDEPPF